MLILTLLSVYAQPSSYNFHKLGFKEGLHDGIIRCIHQDRFGYIWAGSVGAVNRYNGKTFKVYTHDSSDSLSPYGTQPRSMYTDSLGRFWIGFENGLMKFDFQTESFIPIPQFKDRFIASMCSVSKNILFVASPKGLFKYDINKDSVFGYSNSELPKHAALKNNRIYDLKYRNGILYIGSEHGLVYLDIKSDVAVMESHNLMTGLPIVSLDLTKENSIWFCSFGNVKLGNLERSNGMVKIYDKNLNIGNEAQPYHVSACLVDQKNRIWVTGTQEGLMLYDSIRKEFIKYKHKEKIPSSPSGNSYRCMFMDRTGLIWLGLDVEGINYFNPDKNLFTTITAFPTSGDLSLNQVGRAVAMDSKGNLWFGNHDGVSAYNPAKASYQIYRNEKGKKNVLYSNHVRSLYCDDKDNIWIGTSSGINKFNSTTGSIEFIDEKKLPRRFYNSINGDRSGNIWFCTNDTASLYWYNISSGQFGNISTHPQLKKYAGYTPVSYIMEDSKNRLWISVSRKGIVFFDKRNHSLKQLTASDTSEFKIVGNQIIDIKEDSKGVIWISSFTGISGIDTEKNKVINFNKKNGLPGNMVGPLVIDNQDRIWAGVNGGLTMIDKDRKKLRVFYEEDGLASVGFSEHAGIIKDGHNVAIGSNQGYIFFNTNQYKEKGNDFPFYITGCRIQDKEVHNFTNLEFIPTLQLNADENSFSFEFVALNYNNAQRTKYAYFLEGYDNNWHYTSDPYAVYTKVPGGNYTLYLKASDGGKDWKDIKSKSVKMALATVYYKTLWFRVCLILCVLSMIWMFFRYRSKQQNQLFSLQNKAQLLEKEKATAMFDNLKQQLNPHFLFNSLTSLSGLIELDRKIASDFLNQLSVIYRYILKNAENETVLLKDELAFVTMYINLQKTRFSEGLEVNVDVKPEYLEHKIAPVTLQNMIENAIKHNVIDKKRPLVIEIFTNDYDYLVIKNNLQRKSVVETSNQKGLKQFISLYKYLSDRPVIIEDNLTTHFVVKIPLL